MKLRSPEPVESLAMRLGSPGPVSGSPMARPRISSETFMSNAVSPAFSRPPGDIAPEEVSGKRKGWHPGNVMEREAAWLTDSLQGDSLYGQDDLWLTEDSGHKKRHYRCKDAQAARPPARQTSHSRVDSRGTHSAFSKPTLDGSTEEDLYGTAHTHVSPSGDAFSPLSANVRKLFPRTSSLYRRHEAARSGRPEKSQQKKRAPPPPTKRERALQNITGNTLSDPPRQCNLRAIGHVDEAAEAHIDPLERLMSLETQLGRLRAEVRALKAVVGRHGLPFPASTRE